MPTTTLKQATILTAQELEDYRYPIPKSMIQAAGLLKGKKIDVLKYQKEIRADWEKRLQRQIKLARSGHRH